MAKNYTEILCGINQIEKDYYNTISQLNEKSFKEDKEKKAEIKKKIKRLKDIIQYYQEIVDKATTFQRKDFLNFLDSYSELFEDDFLTSKKKDKKKATKKDPDEDNLNFALGMSTWAVGMTTNNPGLKLMGQNMTNEDLNAKSNNSGQKVLFSFKPKVHLADGIKIKEKYKNFPLYQTVFARLINLALENPSLSPNERLNIVLEEEKERRYSGRHR